LGAAAFAFAVTAVALPSCTMSEGERCNISLSHDECASGLTCTMPENCAYAVCCPNDGRPSSSSACNACAAPDDGEDAGTTDDAAASDADSSAAADAAEGG
jgi:hypothetical protein